MYPLRPTDVLLALALALLAQPLAAAGADAVDGPDRYLAGYAAAIVERDLDLEVVHCEVVGGVARVTVRNLGSTPAQRIAEALVRVDGIDAVEVRVDGDGPEPVAEIEDDGEPADADGPGPVADSEDDGEAEDDDLDLFPRVELFEPLLADPRQPHFAAAMLWYLDDPELGRVGSANFGETFALLGGPVGDGPTRWELGILGGVFSIFDLEASSVDLVNTDFWVAPTLSFRRHELSTQLRVYHQSSHLGDEFLLRNRIRRVNLSYEGADLLVSADVHPAVRVYAGGGAIFNSNPHLHPLSVQAGIEIESPVAFLGGAVRPLAAADLQFREENHWDEEISAVAGIQLENPDLSRLRLQILFQYFRGNSPNGQFFERHIEYLGVGTHLHF